MPLGPAKFHKQVGGLCPPYIPPKVGCLPCRAPGSQGPRQALGPQGVPLGPSALDAAGRQPTFGGGAGAELPASL